MTANPYAKFLSDGDVVDILSATPERLAKHVGGISGTQASTPLAPGKWSFQQVLVHLADCEVAFGFRLRQAQAGVSIQPFDQDAWAESSSRYSVSQALETFSVMRAWNLAFVNGLSEAEKQRIVTHPERGQMTLWTIVETMAGHDLNHLTRLDSLRS